MTEHIVNLAIGVDDEAIRNAIITGAEKQIINSIKVDVLNTLFESKYYSCKPVEIDPWTKNVSVKKDAILKDFAMELVKETISEYKDEIIGRAVENIAESYKRSKKFKDAVKNGVIE